MGTKTYWTVFKDLAGSVFLLVLDSIDIAINQLLTQNYNDRAFLPRAELPDLLPYLQQSPARKSTK